VGEGTVGLCHLVGVFLLLEGSAGFVLGVNDFSGEALFVWHTATSAGRLYEPAERVVQLAVSLDWERNLVVRTTDTAAFDFEVRADILECLFKDL